MRGWTKIFHANRQERKAGVAILISDKVDFKNEGHKERQRTLFNGKRIHSRRGYYNHQHICP